MYFPLSPKRTGHFVFVTGLACAVPVLCADIHQSMLIVGRWGGLGGLRMSFPCPPWPFCACVEMYRCACDSLHAYVLCWCMRPSWEGCHAVLECCAWKYPVCMLAYFVPSSPIDLVVARESPSEKEKEFSCGVVPARGAAKITASTWKPRLQTNCLCSIR